MSRCLYCDHEVRDAELAVMRQKWGRLMDGWCIVCATAWEDATKTGRDDRT